MIVLNLSCAADHRFEGWFESAEAFENQRASRLLTCPVCSSEAVNRLPSAPHLAVRQSGHDRRAPGAVAAAMATLRQLAEQSEDVGAHFPDEARRIFYQETEPRAIRGTASGKETRELLEEGIPVIPVPPKATH